MLDRTGRLCFWLDRWQLQIFQQVEQSIDFSVYIVKMRRDAHGSFTCRDKDVMGEERIGDQLRVEILSLRMGLEADDSRPLSLALWRNDGIPHPFSPAIA
jgi:hypothetical protein